MHVSDANLTDKLRSTEAALAQSEALLAKVLPAFIIERLKAQPEAQIAECYNEASVLFADIKGFVAIAHKLGTRRTVDLLNRLTCAFDALAEAHGAEKIKTIGDGYMAVAGVVTQPQDDHSERLVRLANGMIETAADIGNAFSVSLKLRVGIATGPVAAGVIGASKFAFDVWGETVNLASRLESLADVNEILVSEAVKTNLADAFRLTSRRIADVKGLGACELWSVGPELRPSRRFH